jgi:sugar lactone lactonase YvrE
MGTIEPFAKLYGYMPTGVAISREGRMFLCFPRWDDDMLYTVGELTPEGAVKPYPDMALNQPDPENPGTGLYCVQSIVMDERDRLWLLDTGRIRWQPAPAGGPKLVGVDLQTNEAFKTILMPADLVGPDSYMNDVRLGLSKGTEGFAYITDSSRGGLIVVDIGAGTVMHRLKDHPSTQPADQLVVAEGQALYVQPTPEAVPELFKVAADGVALSRDGETLYYCPLINRRLYSISTAALRDPALSEDELAAEVKDLGPKPAVDGMALDDKGRLYLTAFEHNAIMRRLPNGVIETVAQDPRLLWPDTLAIGRDGYLYVTSSQLERMPQFHAGKDLRQRPFVLFRTKIDAEPAVP